MDSIGKRAGFLVLARWLAPGSRERCKRRL